VIEQSDGAARFGSRADELPPLGDEMDAFIGMKAREACSTYSTDSEEITLAIRAHPMYARLVEAYFECRKIGAERDAAEALEREKDAMLYSIQAANNDSTSESPFRDASPQNLDYLDDFMRECTHEIESYAKELHTLFAEAESCCESFETRVRKVKSDLIRKTDRSSGKETANKVEVSRRRAPATSDEQEMDCMMNEGDDSDGNRDLATVRQRRAREEALRQDLKRKYASSILTLKSEFLKKRKKGKLPSDSTTMLKRWWSDNILWPYPSDADKKTLLDKTNLDATQVNNWFINQRKRHWHKLFIDKQPTSKEEAEQLLAESFNGSLAEALRFARGL